MVNLCESCKLSCCYNFSLTQELTDPGFSKRILNDYPFIRRVSSQLTLVLGHEKVVGIYQCIRYNPETRECTDYSVVPRPPFCLNTGVQVAPHSLCLLKKIANPFTG